MRLRGLLVAICIYIAGLFCSLAYALPSVTNIAAQTDSVPQYGLFTVAFDATTVATNKFWPYDPNPAANVAEHPNAIPAGVGVSVEGHFLPPGESNWNNAVVQPGFYHQGFRSDTNNPGRLLDTGSPWIYPNGPPKWNIRFAPTRTGSWKYKIRITDSSGTTTSAENTFDCIAGSSPGFVKVSQTDPRYFETSNGAYLCLIGTHWNDPTDFPTLKSEGVNFLRTWWQSSNPPYALFGAGGQGGDGIWPNCTYVTTYPAAGHLVTVKVPNKTDVWDCINTNVAVKPSTHYLLKATIKTVGITGTGSYGVFVGESFTPAKSAKLTQDHDWTDITLSLTSESYRYQYRVYVGMEGVTGGNAYLSNISLKEDLGSGVYGPELLPRNDFQAHTSYAQDIAWKIDKQLEAAEANRVYIKAVIEEKGDSFFGHISSDGTWLPDAPSNETSAKMEGNVVANVTHACRTYQMYYWRYLVARYGYSTALLGVELFNEGDPNSAAHKNAASALGQYFRATDPNRHLVSTSNWHSVAPIMWSDSNIDTADIHQYVGWTIPSGGNRIIAGWDGSWAFPNNETTPGTKFALDNTVAHSGTNSLKVTLSPNTAETDPFNYTESSLKFQFASTLGHQLRMSYWVKSSNVHYYDNLEFSSWRPNFFFEMSYSMTGGDWIHSGTCPVTMRDDIPSGTTGWVKFTKTWTVSADTSADSLATMEWCRLCERGNHDAATGYVWIDDIVIEDLTTGLQLNYNGGFEYTQPEAYDIAANHCAFSRILRGFNFSKPIFRGETGICNPGGTNEEDPTLATDTTGVWWRDLVWAHLDAGGLVDIYWWGDKILSRHWTYAKAYQLFIAGVPLNNGNYKEVSASASNPALRVVGQKDLVNNRAHIWIQNFAYTWKSVVDSVAIPASTGTVTVPGLADGSYFVEWWDTTSGTILRMETLQSAGGNLVLTLTNLQSDIACKIYPKPARVDLRILVPTNQVIPGQIVTVTVEFTNSGESVAQNVEVSAKAPALMDYVAGSAEESGGSYTQQTNTVTWVIDTLSAHQTSTKTFRVKVQ